MIKKKSDVALLLILVLLIFLINLSPDARATYNLESKELIYYINKAYDCDIEAILKIEAHYVVNDNKIEYNRWKKKEKICRKIEILKN